MSKLSVTIEGYTFEIELNLLPNSGNEIFGQVNGKPVKLSIPDMENSSDELQWIIVEERPYEVVIDRELEWIKSARGMHAVEFHDLEAPVSRPPVGNGRIKAPIPGKITRIMVESGDEVEAGQPLFVVEAMKMENEIRAPRAGKITLVNVVAGQEVKLHEVLLEIE
jgi:biotin carboxyl carrier protein